MQIYKNLVDEHHKTIALHGQMLGNHDDLVGHIMIKVFPGLGTEIQKIENEKKGRRENVASGSSSGGS